MRPRLTVSIALASLLCLAALAAAQAPATTGAKELFFDPTDASIVSVTKDATARPASAVKSAPGASKSKSSVKQARSTTPKLDAQGRRSVTNANAVDTKTLGLSYWIELADAKEATGTQVTDARVFHSGERLRLHFRSNADGYISLIQMGSSGTASVLFPDPAKGLGDNHLTADQDRVLPSDAAWFRFDATPGTEKLLVLFGKSTTDLESFPVKSSMDPGTTQALVRSTDSVRGSKDLILETETQKASEVGTYAVNVSGKPIVLEIQLRHQ